MAKMYYEDECNLDVLMGKVAVIGLGARAMPMHLI